MNDSTQRFSSRVENYVKYRPGYPAAVVDFLKSECQLVPAHTIADVGSGTGKLTELFLQNGNRVIGIEPNKEMREAAERLLSAYPRFQSIAATAEATTLPDHSVDMITAGQAFHWFDRQKARQEFLHILKPAGWVVLIWNDRKTDASLFLAAYEEFLQTYGTDYLAVNHKNVDAEMIGSFFGAGGFKRATFPNEQIFDLGGLQGRLLSSSYAPEAGHPKHVPMLEALGAIFHQHAVNGKVRLECDTVIYYGRLSA
ncbi:MAG: Methyltransferase [Pedosphaera sp.]|nr:Methyltransferase [Pedosphaera sp.]